MGLAVRMGNPDEGEQSLSDPAEDRPPGGNGSPLHSLDQDAHGTAHPAVTLGLPGPPAAWYPVSLMVAVPFIRPGQCMSWVVMITLVPIMERLRLTTRITLRSCRRARRVATGEANLVQASGFRHFGKRHPQRVCHPLAVRRIGLQAVADVADLDLLGSVAHGAGGVGKEQCFLLGTHQAEEPAGLGVIIAVLAMIPVVGSPFQAERRFGKIRLLLPLAVTVRFVAKRAAMIAV